MFLLYGINLNLQDISYPFGSIVPSCKDHINQYKSWLPALHLRQGRTRHPSFSVSRLFHLQCNIMEEMETLRLVYLPILAIYCLFMIGTTLAAACQYTTSLRNLRYLFNRPLGLTVLQAIASTVVGVLSAVGSAFPSRRCAYKLWSLYVGVLVWLAIVAIQAAQHLALLQSPILFASGTKKLSKVPALWIITKRHKPDCRCAIAAHGGKPASICYLNSTKSCLLLILGWWIIWLVVALVINSQSLYYSLCQDGHGGWELWPAYGMSIFFVGLLFPFLAIKVIRGRTQYGRIPLDVLLCMMVIAPLTLLIFVIWQNVIVSIRDVVSEMMVLWFASLCAQCVTVIYPLFNSVRSKATNPAKHQHQLSLSGFDNSFRGSQFRRSTYNNLYKDFCLMLDTDSRQREELFQFAVQSYKSTIPAFLNSYQQLKYNTIEELGKTICADRSIYGTPQSQPRLPQVENFSSDTMAGTSIFPSKVKGLPVTKGMLELAETVLPLGSVNQDTCFPDAMKTALASLVNMYLDCSSYMSLEISSDTIKRANRIVRQEKVPLVAIDEAKDEALLLLCSDTYKNFICQRRVDFTT